MYSYYIHFFLFPSCMFLDFRLFAINNIACTSTLARVHRVICNSFTEPFTESEYEPRESILVQFAKQLLGTMKGISLVWLFKSSCKTQPPLQRTNQPQATFLYCDLVLLLDICVKPTMLIFLTCNIQEGLVGFSLKFTTTRPADNAGEPRISRETDVIL